MRIVLLFLLSLAFFCGCTQAGSNDTDSIIPGMEPSKPDVGLDSSELPLTNTQSSMEELPYSFLLSPDFDRSKGIVIPTFNLTGEPIAYDFGELLLEEYPYGEWSVNELEEKYGEAIWEFEGSLPTKEYIEIGGGWNDVDVTMRGSRDGTLSFDSDSNPKGSFYPLNDQDRAIKLPVRRVHIYRDSLPLSRGLRIGHSTVENVKSSYLFEGSEVKDSPGLGAHQISYKYIDFDKIATKPEIERSDIGSIVYWFEDGVLCTVHVCWKTT